LNNGLLRGYLKVLLPSFSNIRQAAMPAFKHEALGQEADAIRILRVERAHPGRKYVSWLLESVSLSSIQHTFIAVSHVWGSDDRTFKILVNGQSYFVTPQLWQFLLLAAERVSDKPLWIDAICIDQGNVAEKETQLPLMGLIFSKTQKLIAWLHSPIDGEHRSPTTADANCVAAQAIADDACDIFEHLEEEEETAQALLRLLFHKYWSRVWIVQELRLSGVKEFWWEGQIISSQRLELIATVINARFKQDLPALSRSLWWDLCATGESAKQNGDKATLLDHMSAAGEDGRRYFVKTDETSDLADLVAKHKNFDCSITFDRVFAFLGLVKGGDQFKVQYDERPTDLLARIWITSLIVSSKQCRDIGQALGINWSLPIVVLGVGRSWAGHSWTDRSWADRSWAGRSWAGRSWHTELEDVLRCLQVLVPNHLREQVLEIRQLKTLNTVDRTRHFIESFSKSSDNTSRLREAGRGEIGTIGKTTASYADLLARIKRLVKSEGFERTMSLSALGIYLNVSLTHRQSVPVNYQLQEVWKIARTARRSDMEGDEIVVRHIRFTPIHRLKPDILNNDFGKTSGCFSHDFINSPCQNPDGSVTVQGLTPAKFLELLRMSDDDHPIWEEAQQWTLPVIPES
jgi:Heterokaryon incompatibility protein (HET)